MRWGVLRTINERTDKIGMWKWKWVWVWMEMGMGQDRMDKMGCDVMGWIPRLAGGNEASDDNKPGGEEENI